LSSNRYFPHWTFQDKKDLDTHWKQSSTWINDRNRDDWLLLNHQFLIREVKKIKMLMKKSLVKLMSDPRQTEVQAGMRAHSKSSNHAGSGLRKSYKTAEEDQSVYVRERPPKTGDKSSSQRLFVPSLEYLAEAFDLTPFERSVLVLCAGRELDSEVGTLCGAIYGKGNEGLDIINSSNNNYDYSNNSSNTNDSNNHSYNRDSFISINSSDHLSSYPNFALASIIFPDAHWSAISPSSPLRYYELINLHQYPELSLVNYPLHINERILHFLLGIFYLDEKVGAISRSIISGISIKKSPLYLDSHKRVAYDVSSILNRFSKKMRMRRNSLLFREPVLSSNSVLPQMHQRGQTLDKSDKEVDLPVIELFGKDNVGKHIICENALLGAQITPVSIPCGLIPSKAEDLENLRRTLLREALLMSLGYHFQLTEDTKESTRYLLDLVDNEILSRCPIVVSNGLSGHKLQLVNRSKLSFDVKRPTRQEQHQLWRQFLNFGSAECSGSMMLEDLIRKICNYFDLSVSEIKVAAEQVRFQQARIINTTSSNDDIGRKGAKTNTKSKSKNVLGLSPSPSSPSPSLLATDVRSKTEEVLWDFLKSQIRQKFTSPAASSVSVSSQIKFDDLILPRKEKELLENILIHVRHKTKVYDDWGLGKKKKYGLNTIALFSGASGTGKTMAAEIIAGRLDLDLYEVDLSETVSKYVGETEKNLSRIFEAAEGGGCVLFFDEADSLFGKRTDVKDSHDRYGNIGVAYLLKRIESSQAVLTILATNMKEVIDKAFMRRIKFIVNFPLPDQDSRRQIWKSVFPPTSPTRDIDFPFLSRMNITGAQIKNIAENAAFLAANENTSIGMNQIKRAAQMEFVKVGRTLPSSSDEDRWQS